MLDISMNEDLLSHINYDSHVEWEDLTRFEPLPLDFLEYHLDEFNSYSFSNIWQYQTLSENFIEKNHDFFIIKKKMTFRDKLELFNTKNLSIINKYKDTFYSIELWELVSEYQKLSESFIEKHADKLNWEKISSHQKLSESFIEKHADKIAWYFLGKQELSESFIEKHKNKGISWWTIIEHQKLSESFIEKHKDEIQANGSLWTYVFLFQELSDEFIIKYKDTVKWDRLFKEPSDLSDDKIARYKNLI